MHRILKKNEILTIPNLLSLVRLAMIPLIVWLYCGAKNYYAAIGVILLSGATDVIDGWIARHFNMVSDFGKILDPVADKLTQATLLLCLLSKYKLMWALVVLFAVCEIGKLSLGAVVMKKHDEVNSAKWYGKVNTVMIYAIMMILILFPNMNSAIADALITLCGAVMLISHLLYARFYYRILRGGKKNRNGKEKG